MLDVDTDALAKMICLTGLSASDRRPHDATEDRCAATHVAQSRGPVTTQTIVRSGSPSEIVAAYAGDAQLVAVADVSLSETHNQSLVVVPPDVGEPRALL